MTQNEKIEMSLLSANWIIEESNVLIEEHKKAKTEHEKCLISDKLKNISKKIDFEKNELSKYL